MLISTLAECLDRSVSGDAWHGPSLMSVLADVTPEEAGARPISGAHSILEIVLHVAAWMGEAASRLRGQPPAQPAQGDWPQPIPWPDARARLHSAARELREGLAAFDESRLGDMVGAAREAPLGTGVTFTVMLVGVAEHNAYHGGQIALLKRALREVS